MIFADLTAASHPAQPTVDVSWELHEHLPRISFNGAMNVASMQRLVRMLDQAFRYYQYDSVLIEIDSPGGEIPALNYFLEHMSYWQARGRAVRTTGLVTCASAAALLLAFGNIGGRSLYSGTHLLFHLVRMPVHQQMLTAEAAHSMKSRLETVDTTILELLVEHITFQHRGNREDGLRRFAAQFRRRRAWIGAEYPLTRRGILKPDPEEIRAVLSSLDQIAATGEPDEIEASLKQHLQLRFRSDEALHPAEAWALNLVDRIIRVTPEQGQLGGAQ
jgi:ATP-dependent protease ClpP protease subunit